MGRPETRRSGFEDVLAGGIVPVVPVQGSVGASGDLAPLAHFAAGMLGEGEALVDGTRLPGGEALKRAGIRPLVLSAKEGLALINGTQFSTAWALKGVIEAHSNCTTALITGALSVDAAQSGRIGPLKRNLWLTTVLGTLFLGIKIFDYVHMWHNGFTISTNLFGSCYYLITAFHGLHVLSGIILILTLIAGVNKGRFTSSNYGRIEYSGLYWHFVDVIWVILFAFLCLL